MERAIRMNRSGKEMLEENRRSKKYRNITYGRRL